MAEDKKSSKPESRYGKTEKKPDKPAAKKPEPAADDAGDKPAGDGKSALMDMMLKRHEKEHRDLHGQHRDAMRDMFARHETEMADMHGQMAGAGDGADGAPDTGAEPADAPQESA